MKYAYNVGVFLTYKRSSRLYSGNYTVDGTKGRCKQIF